MPILETCRMEKRVGMLLEYASGNWSVTWLCRRNDVSRDTLYEWRKLRESGDANCFTDHSHAPRSSAPDRSGAGRDASWRCAAASLI